MKQRTGEDLLATKSGSNIYIPDRGHIIWIDFDPQAGHEVQKRRPAIVISPMLYNAGKRTLALVCPVTNRICNYAYEVVLPNTMITTGAILSDQLKSLDWKARNATFIEKAPANILLKVSSKAKTLFP